MSNNTASHPRSLESSATLLGEAQVSYRLSRMAPVPVCQTAASYPGTDWLCLILFYLMFLSVSNLDCNSIRGQECWFGKCVEGNSCGLIFWGTSSYFVWRGWGKLWKMSEWPICGQRFEFVTFRMWDSNFSCFSFIFGLDV
jgi:hypothetical protein